MKTAILISGHMRSFDRCLPTLHWHVFRRFARESNKCQVTSAEEQRCDFFVSTEPDADAPKAELLREKYPAAQVSIDTTPQPDVVAGTGVRLPLRELRLASLHIAAAHAPYAISVPVEAVLGQLWRLQRCWEFFEANRRDDDYDLIIRCRPDLWMESFRPSWQLNLWEKTAVDLALTPWWGRFGGVNDRFAILRPVAARGYFTTWSQVSTLIASGCPLHPESLIHAALEANGCEIGDLLEVSFSTLRPPGPNPGAPFALMGDGCWRRFPEISAQDIAHRCG